MKPSIRMLARHGNALHVCIEKRFLDYMRWQGGDRVLVEVNERGNVEIRRVRPSDMNADLQLGPVNRLPEAAAR